MTDLEVPTKSDPRGARSRTQPTDLDVFRLRSDGPLAPRELAYCRQTGIPLAYDPVQIGWVTASCTDDFDPEVQTLDPRSRHSVESKSLGPLIVDFDARVGLLVRQTRDHEARTPTEISDSVWALPEQVVRATGNAFDRALRLRGLRVLQSRAHALIREQVEPRQDRARRRHDALMRGRDYILRPWRPTEAARFRELLDDLRVWEHLPEAYPDPLTDSMASALIEISNSRDHHEVRAIERNGEVVGQIRMLFDGPRSGVDSQEVDAEISYWLGARYWGEGIAGDVIPLFTLLSFRKRRLASVFARVAEDNVASRRALARAGYRDEGDLSAELAGNFTTRTLRCYRGDYVGTKLGTVKTVRTREFEATNSMRA